MSTSKRDIWLERVRQWLDSGLTCREYAERAGINYSTLSWWKSRLVAEGEDLSRAHDETPAFVEVMPATIEPADDGCIAIDVQGVTIRVRDGFCQRTLGDVLTVLEGRS